MLNAVVFPSGFYNSRRVSEDFQREYDAAAECGLYDEIIVFSDEDWFHSGKLVFSRAGQTPITAVYRGWMMQPEQYTAFYGAFAERNVVLIPTPEEYEAFHVFPNVYGKLRRDTPRIMLFPKGEPVDLCAVKRAFPRFMVKDYVKSVKGTDFPAFFDGSVTQEEFDGWMKKFYEYRGSLFTGGICVKEFVELKSYGGRKNEHRVFYINDEIAAVNRNSGQAPHVPAPPRELTERYRGLGSRFYTVDFAELSDGGWVVIEAGDGSVSGLSDFQDYGEFYRSLYYCFA